MHLVPPDPSFKVQRHCCVAVHSRPISNFCDIFCVHTYTFLLLLASTRKAVCSLIVCKPENLHQAKVLPPPSIMGHGIQIPG